jgi:predicted MPP superfamily phosphohydrolase
MARYTCSFIIAVPLERLQQVLIEVLESCNFDIIYNTGDYLMAREIPGHVSFAKLVTVEVLIDKSTATEQEVRMNFCD